jgi:hypothetical protein
MREGVKSLSSLMFFDRLPAWPAGPAALFCP